MKRADADGVDAGAIREAVERAFGELAEVRKVKSQLTGAKSGIDNAYELIEGIAERVRARSPRSSRWSRPAAGRRASWTSSAAYGSSRSLLESCRSFAILSKAGWISLGTATAEPARTSYWPRGSVCWIVAVSERPHRT